MLRRNDDRVDAVRHAVAVFDRHLRFSVGTKIGKRSVLAYRRETAGKLVGKRNGKRHKLGRFVAGITEHHTLVARADVVFVGIAVFGFERFVNAERNVGRLLVDGA